jgi:hypothetical protein
MLRLGPPSSETREMDLDDIFFSRLKLMIIMAKAYLAGYPLGEHRSRAMFENAEHIETDALHLGDPAATDRSRSNTEEQMNKTPYDHLFFQRVKLLAIMIKAVAKGFPMDENRKTAMQENLDMICCTLMFQGKAEDMAFLKVA